jgi:hypothetical protein
MRRYEYKVIDTDKHIEEQLMIAPPQAIILMREVRVAGQLAA